MRNHEPEVVAEFHRCPACGSNQGFATSMANQEREKGLIRDSLECALDQMGGLIIDRVKSNEETANVPVPGIRALVDVCLNCGNVYAVRLEQYYAPANGKIRQRIDLDEVSHDGKRT